MHDHPVNRSSLPAHQPEIARALAHAARSAGLTVQERSLLEHLVKHTVAGDTARLYQKAIAEDLKMPTPDGRQVGVVAARLRAKLRECPSPGGDALRIALAERGYAVDFFFPHVAHSLDDATRLAVANAKAALDQRTIPGANAALRHLAHAFAATPDHPLHRALEALCYATRAMYGTSPRSDLERAERILQPTTASVRPWEAVFTEACVRMALHWDWEGAGRAFDRAIAMSGGVAEQHPWYTAFLASQCRAHEAVPHLRKAVTAAFDSPIVRADLAINQIFAGQLDDAQETLDTAFALFGERAHYLLFIHQAILLEARDNPRGAAEAIVLVPLSWPHTAITFGLRALFSGLSGKRGRAYRKFIELRAARVVARRHVPAAQVAIAALGAGRVDEAVSLLHEGAVKDRDNNLVLLNVFPFFRHIHDHAGFRELLQTMRLRLPASNPR